MVVKMLTCYNRPTVKKKTIIENQKQILTNIKSWIANRNATYLYLIIINNKMKSNIYHFINKYVYKSSGNVDSFYHLSKLGLIKRWNILVHDLINLLYYKHWLGERIFFHVCNKWHIIAFVVSTED